MAKNFRSTREFREAMLEALGTTQDKDVENEANYKSALLEALGVEHTRSDVVNFETFREKLVEGVTNYSGGSGGGGSSDFSTAKVTIIGHNDARVFMSPSFPYVADNNTSVTMGIQEENSHIYTVVLYKGSAWGVVRNADIIAMTGGIELSQDEEFLIVTGDGTLTINPWQD